MAWWAIQAQSQLEEYVYYRLVERGYTAFWPHVDELVATGHKAKSRLLRRSWLTGYLFVEADRKDLGAVKRLPGVAAIVRGASAEPSPIPTEWVTDLMTRCDHWGGVIKTNKQSRRNKFRIGDFVRIISENSPLLGMMGEVSRIIGDKVVVELPDLGSVIISEKFVKKTIDTL